MSGKLKPETVTRIAPAKARRRAQLLPFPGMKKPRGRPKKDATSSPAPESFDTIAAAIMGLNASSFVWDRAAERQRLAMHALRLRPTTIATVDFVTGKLNRSVGFDMHSAEFMAAAFDCTEENVRRGVKEGVDKGFLKRRQVGRRWETTVPKMIALCMEVKRELDGHQAPARVSKKQSKRNQKMGAVTGNSNAYPENLARVSENTSGRNQKGGDTYPETPPKSFIGILDVNPIRARAREDDISNSNLADGARPEGTADNAATARHRDTTLPLADRITLDGADREFLQSLSKGWPLPTLRDQYVAWASASKAPVWDAQKAFKGWLITTQAKRVPATAEALAALAGNPEAQVTAIVSAARKERWDAERTDKELRKLWAAEDKLDAPLRAPFDPIKDKLRRMRLAQCNALVLRRLRGKL